MRDTPLVPEDDRTGETPRADEPTRTGRTAPAEDTERVTDGGRTAPTEVRETPDEAVTETSDEEAPDRELIEQRFTRHRAGNTVVLYDRLEQTTWVQADIDPSDLV